jgi:hypothetical protein
MSLQQEKIARFEKEYREMAEKDLALAKQYFRESFLAKCFNCKKLVALTEEMCCPECGTYLG